jgi:hypothetical protein
VDKIPVKEQTVSGHVSLRALRQDNHPVSEYRPSLPADITFQEPLIYPENHPN